MLDGYLGQDEAISQLRAEISAVKAGATTLPDMLFLGPPGTGKTTLARALAREMAVPFEVLHCPNASDRESVASKIVAAQKGILFCEEIHALLRIFAEDMFTVIDDNVVTLSVPIMEQKKKLRVEGLYIKTDYVAVPTGRYEMATRPIDPVTVIGATTDEALLPAAFLSRLSGLVVRLEPYETQTLAEMAVNHAADRYGIRMESDTAHLLAERSRENPRRLKQLVERTFAQWRLLPRRHHTITIRPAHAALAALKIDKRGLEEPHRKVLHILENGPVSRTTLAQKMGIPAKNFDLYWAELMRLDMVTIGRKHEITDKGLEALA